jgi:hypothetical protein
METQWRLGEFQVTLKSRVVTAISVTATVSSGNSSKIRFDLNGDHFCP